MLWDTAGIRAEEVCSLTRPGNPGEGRYNRHVTWCSARNKKNGKISDSLERHLTYNCTLKMSGIVTSFHTDEE